MRYEIKHLNNILWKCGDKKTSPFGEVLFYGVGVIVVVGDDCVPIGVLVAPIVLVGVTRLTATVMTSPTRILSGSAICLGFRRMISSLVVLNLDAMIANVSPDWIVY